MNMALKLSQQVHIENTQTDSSFGNVTEHSYSTPSRYQLGGFSELIYTLYTK